MKRAALFFFLSLAALPLLATEVTQDITVNTTWTVANSPYVLTGDINVSGPNNPVLTIEAGVVVKGNAGARLTINAPDKGTLDVNASATNPVRFTSNGPATRGFWSGLYFGSAAGATPSRVNYAVVEYAGSTSPLRGGITSFAQSVRFDVLTIRENLGAGIVINAGSVSINGSEITSNGGPGINAVGGTSLYFTTTRFTNNSGYAVTMPPEMLLSTRGGNTATGNTGGNALEIRAGTITSNSTWKLLGSGFPYVVSGLVAVRAVNASASVPVLTVEPGVTVKFNQAADLLINHGERGVFQANGTAEQPILFTSNGPATPGYWAGLGFSTAATASVPPSKISHATIEFAGIVSAQRGGVTIRSGSVILEHVTLTNNLLAGVLLRDGALTVIDSTSVGNDGAGLKATGGTALSLDGTSFTRNTGKAVDMVPFVPLLSAGNLSAADNAAGGDGICYSAGTIAVSTAWPASTLPYILTGNINVLGPSVPVLTIAAGNEIRFNSGVGLIVHEGNAGALQANGTAAKRIRFTSNGTQAPGSWGGIVFGTGSGPASRISYATVEYAGHSSGWGAITVRTQAPEFDHLVLRENLYAGLLARDQGTPRISNSQFLGNPRGIATFGATAKVHATLNYWSSANGPCLEPCTGAQSVTPSVTYEPWLVAAPNEPFYLSSATHKNPTFNPLIGTQSFVEYGTSMSGNVTVAIRNAANQLVRTLTASSPETVFWNGKDESGVVQPNGKYDYEIAATAQSQVPAVVARGFAFIDHTRALTLSNPTVTQAFFSPNADAVQDTTMVSAASNFDDTSWTVSVLDASNNVVRTQTGNGLSFAFDWNGQDGAAALQRDGVYKLRVEASVGAAPAGASVTKDASTTLDNTPPVALIATPEANQRISNIYANGSTLLTPTGTASDLNLLDWNLHVGPGANPPGNSWSPLGFGTATVTAGGLVAPPWETVNRVGVYALRLTVRDKAGNLTAFIRTPITFAHFKAEQSVYEFNGSTNGTVTYTSTVPFPVTESIVVKNLAGNVVRNLVGPVLRNTGTFQDVFNGRGDDNALLPDGPYFYVAIVQADGYTFHWDLSNVMRNLFPYFNDGLVIAPFDPFNNKPMTFNYNFPFPGRVSVATNTVNKFVDGNCAAPSSTFFCAAEKVWQESGPQTFTWWGIDHTGAYRTIRGVGIRSDTNEFPQNASILFGSKPKLRGVKVTPPVFGPEVGQQAIEFDLEFTGKPVSVSIDLVNLATKSVLRTLTAPSQPSGHGSVLWDGRAHNGMLVAPGRYNVIVTVTDGIGNVVRSGILTEIQY